ncbi:MAG: ferritin [Chitinivibrionales bacterium]
MIDKTMEKALNSQMHKEMYSAYLYMSMSSYADSIGLKGVANWFMVQYHEEMIHGMKIYEYITRQGGRPYLAAIEEPPADFESVLVMFEKALEHEQFITKSIHDLVNLAIEQKDHATHIFLQWYVTEQVEEEENVNDILAQIRLVGEGKGDGIFMIDKELGSRVTNVPTDFSKGIESAMNAGQ